MSWFSSLPTLPVKTIFSEELLLFLYTVLSGYLTCHGLQGGGGVDDLLLLPLHGPGLLPLLAGVATPPPAAQGGRHRSPAQLRVLPRVVVELVGEEEVASGGTLVCGTVRYNGLINKCSIISKQ